MSLTDNIRNATTIEQVYSFLAYGQGNYLTASKQTKAKWQRVAKAKIAELEA